MADAELTVKQAARELGRSARTVRDWAQRGTLSGRRIRGRRGMEWRIAADSVRRKAADHAAGATRRGGGDAATEAGDAAGGYSALVEEVRSLREDNAEYRAHLIGVMAKRAVAAAS